MRANAVLDSLPFDSLRSLRVGSGCALIRIAPALLLTHLPVLDGFGNVIGSDGSGAIQVGDGAGDFDQAEVTAGGEVVFFYRSLENAVDWWGEGAIFFDQPVGHLRVGVNMVGGESLML